MNEAEVNGIEAPPTAGKEPNLCEIAGEPDPRCNGVADWPEQQQDPSGYLPKKARWQRHNV